MRFRHAKGIKEKTAARIGRPFLIFKPSERDDFSSNRHPALSFCLSMISAQTLRVCREGKPVPTPHQVRGRLFPDHALVQKLAELFKDFSQVHDVFLDDPLSLRFVRLFARAKPVVDSFASVLFQVRHHISRFSLCPNACPCAPGSTGCSSDSSPSSLTR